MDHLIGLVGKDFALVAADRKVAHSIIAVKNDEDKILALDQHKLLACGGELGDTKNFSEYIQKNIALYNLRNGVKLTTHAAAHYTRGEIAHAIRNSPKMCNMLLVGYDEDAGASLYHIDYMGGMHKMNYGSHGYGGFFAASLLDRYNFPALFPTQIMPVNDGVGLFFKHRLWKPDMSLEEGMAIMKKVFTEINTRFLIGGSTFSLKIVDKDGIRVIDLESEAMKS
jgi:20S proteasome subunit beta 4